MATFRSIVLFLIIFASLQRFSVSAVEFDVGDTQGWVVPPANDSNIYNEWASEKRFQIGDTIRFIYNKDSVLVVTDEEYKDCNSTHPIFFSNNGNTVFKFDRSGLFYFISGVSGHCERGEKMIIKVLATEDTPSSSDDDSSGSKSAAAKYSAVSALALAFIGSSSLMLF